MAGHGVIDSKVFCSSCLACLRRIELDKRGEKMDPDGMELVSETGERLELRKVSSYYNNPLSISQELAVLLETGFRSVAVV